MKTLRARGRVFGLSSALLLALAAACATHSGRPADPAAAPTAAAAEPELRLGEPIERELAPEETHTFLLPLKPAHYLRVMARPRAMDIALRLIGPDGKAVAEADGPDGSKERELLSAITTASGPHHLLVARRDQGERRVYKLELQEIRLAKPDEQRRVQAERAFAEGLHRLALGTKENLEEAHRRFEQSLSLWQAIGDRTGQVDCLNHVGAVFYFSGDSKGAITQFEKALALAESAGYRRGVGEALNNLGLAYTRLGDRDSALRYYRRAIEVWQDLQDPAETARAWHNLGWFYLQRGEADLALQSLSEALKLRQVAGDVAGEAYTLQALGVLNLSVPDPRAAHEYFSRALPLSRAAGNLRLEAYLLGSLATVYRQEGDLQRALQLHREVTERFEALGDAPRLANAFEALASLYLDLGDFEKAASQYQRALGIYRDRGNRDFEARVLGSIGLTLFRQGNAEGAFAAYDEALQISEVTQNRGTEIAILSRRGVTRYELGDLRAALEDLEACLELQQATGDQREKASVLLALGSVLRDLGDQQAAVERLKEALEIGRRTQHPFIQSGVLLRLSEIERDRGNLEVARDMLETALAIIESVREGVVHQDFRVTYSAARRTYYDVYIDLLMRLDHASPERGFAEEAFQASERSRARSLAELLAEGRINVRRGVAAEFKEREIRIGVEISKLQTSLFEESSRESHDDSKIANLDRQLDEALEDRERLEEEIRLRHPRYAEVRYPEPIVTRDLQSTLDPGTAFLEYVLGAEVSYLFVVTTADFRSFRLPPSRELQSEVERFRQALARPERRMLGQLRQSARQLYRTLVAPAAEMLRTRAEWVIASDGALHLLPFEALLTDLPGPALAAQHLPYLVMEHSIAYVPSANVLLSLRARKSDAGGRRAADGPKFLAFADPLYGAAEGLPDRVGLEAEPGRALPELPETRHEAEAIARLYSPGQVALYLGPQATEENVKGGELSSARRIHFAVHGHLDETRPELSGLVLSRARQSDEDGLLQAYEIFNLEVNADLVVLSACETGLGKQFAGEGLVGLSRAFLYAGTPSLLVSLWRVADTSTTDIMIEFYRRLEGGEEKAEALRGAKLRALASSRLAHPFHWASFILVGDG